MNPLKVTVGDVSDNAITLDVSNNILDARNVMMKYNISRVIITDDNMPVEWLQKRISYVLYILSIQVDQLKK